MCLCNSNKTCPECDPGFRTFFQDIMNKIREDGGGELLDAGFFSIEDAWHEYLDLRDQSIIEDFLPEDEEFPDEGW